MDNENKTEDQSSVVPPQPGSVVAPRSNDEPPSHPQPETTSPPAPAQQVQSSTPNVEPAPGNFSGDSISNQSSSGDIGWSGPEFIAHEKSPKWFMSTILTAAILGALFYLLTKDAITTAVVASAVMLLGVYGLRRPKNIDYQLSDNGISIGPKQFVYEEFKSFIASEEGNYMNITLIPLKRFSPPTGLCYSGKDEQKIVDFLSKKLPLEQHKPDIIDRLMLRIRF